MLHFLLNYLIADCRDYKVAFNSKGDDYACKCRIDEYPGYKPSSWTDVAPYCQSKYLSQLC